MDRLQALWHVKGLFTLKAVLRAKFLPLEYQGNFLLITDVLCWAWLKLWERKVSLLSCRAWAFSDGDDCAESSPSSYCCPKYSYCVLHLQSMSHCRWCIFITDTSRQINVVFLCFHLSCTGYALEKQSSALNLRPLWALASLFTVTNTWCFVLLIKWHYFPSFNKTKLASLKKNYLWLYLFLILSLFDHDHKFQLCYF